jgi:succinate dehydrogenase/fumarate reductase flavoprotein subunit
MRTPPSPAVRRNDAEVLWSVPEAACEETLPSAYQARDLMWRQVGLLRDRELLVQAVATLQGWYLAARRARAVRDNDDPGLLRVFSIVTVGLLIARAALRREESRGAHFRSDFPSRDDLHWGRHVSEVWTQT